MGAQHQDEPGIVAIDITSRMGVIDRDDCVGLIESTPVGRIGFISDGAPLVLPVNFASPIVLRAAVL